MVLYERVRAFPPTKHQMNPKKCLTKKQQIEIWTQLLLQARLDGNTSLVKKYEAIITKLTDDKDKNKL